MPFGNANDQTQTLLRKQILPRITDVPIVIGLFANDPASPLTSRLKKMKKLGLAGITNYPFLVLFLSRSLHPPELTGKRTCR